MFDVATAELIREAPALSGVDPLVLPQELTRVYSDLVVLRLKGTSVADDPDQVQALQRLKRIADIYEGAVDAGAEGNARRAAAFVAATAHQMLGRIYAPGYEPGQALLEPDSIHPALAAPLLFLIAEQNADARESARPLGGIRTENRLRSAVIESVFDLVTERYASILERATRLRLARVNADGLWITSAADALYGLCWSGIVQMVSHLLGQPFPELEFRRFDTPRQAFDQVVLLATGDIDIDSTGPGLVSSFAGPRHLARLLGHLADDLMAAGILGVDPPGGIDQQFWNRWVRHRAKAKPVLWRNHREAIAEGILESGRSAVLVLPTGAGKTTLSELKIASTLARNKKVLFLVPTLALVDQLRDELEEAFPKSLGGIQVEVSSDGDLTGLIVGPELQTIEVMTPERCLALLSHAPDAVNEVGLLVFDECHLLSPKGGGKRSLDAMLCLLHALKRAAEADLLLLSAMLTNSKEFADWIQESTGRPCAAYQNPWKPSRQARGVVVYRRQDLANIGNSREMIPYGLFGLHQHWNPQSAADLRLVSLSDEPIALTQSARGWATPNANGVANELAIQASKAGLKTIVFVQQADYALTNAKKIANKLAPSSALTAAEDLLWATIQAELGGAEFSLVRPDDRALPHNGDMIPQERRLAESMFKREEGASVIVATPTLAQGMNLPAQMAILAGDKRQDERGRSALEAHEILNAAGRAGRAGHLANGIVLLIPDPVAAFTTAGKPEPGAIGKLRQILPQNDQCVPMDDPLTAILDQIQAGNQDAVAVRYFASRVQAAEPAEGAVAKAVSMIRGSFAAFKARQVNEEELFDLKLEALRTVLADNIASPEITIIAASTGLPNEPLLAAQAMFAADLSAIPTSVVAWVDWMVGFFAADQNSYLSLLGDDANIVNYVVRGKKNGPPPTASEFALLRAGLKAWVTGHSFYEIELALGVAPNKVKCCPRARDLVLKLANRSLYLIAASLADVAKLVYIANSINPSHPAVLETLAVAIRKGLDTPDKIAFAYRRPSMRSRVNIHSGFAEILGTPMDTAGLDYATVLNQMTSRIAFAEDSQT
jgi:ATP-dependent RNA helicase HelY